MAKPGAKGAKGCNAYLIGIQKTFVTEMVKFATQPHVLIHLDASDRKYYHSRLRLRPSVLYNFFLFFFTFWMAGGKTFSGFLDYGSMGKVGSDAYKKARCDLSISKSSF
jgi:hypothetical protein